MFNQCPNCDAMISNRSTNCKCGFSIPKHQRVKKEQKKCEMSSEGCNNSSSHVLQDLQGNSHRYCLRHYDQLRPKTDIEKEIERRIEKIRVVIGIIGAPSLKKIMEKVACMNL